MKRIICLYGGPGIAKSTTCAGLFYFLKKAGKNCEMNREVVKEWVWEGRQIKPGDQPFFFSTQSRFERIYMENNLDFIITDSPLILTHFYGIKYDEIEKKYNTSLAMLQNHHKICQDFGYKVDHYLLTRNKPYNPAGRLQTEEEALEIDREIRQMLDEIKIRYEVIDAEDPVQEILKRYI